MEEAMTTKTKLTDALEDDFFDDAVTAQYLISRLLEDALAMADEDDDEETTSNDLDWVIGARR
jgi:hypothetical protein